MGCGLPNGVGKPAFTPKERDSCAPYKFVSAIVISSPAALAVANVLIVVDMAGVLRWSIAASCVVHGVAAIRVADARRETVAQYAAIILGSDFEQ